MWQEIGAAFFPEAAFAEITPVPGGKINESYRLEMLFPRDRCRRYFLQRINRTVFSDPAALQWNIFRLFEHYRERRSPGLKLAEPYRTACGALLHTDSSGECWRLAEFIPDCYAVSSIDSARTAESIGRQFAIFVLAFRDFRYNLRRTLPGFHDLESRFREFQAAIVSAIAGRARLAGDDVARFRESAPLFLAAFHRLRLLPVPSRIVHNDPKINNILFSCSDNLPVAVVDLDTTHYGYLWQDLGDLLRSALSGSEELDGSAAIDWKTVAALCSGYLEPLRETLTAPERESLAAAPAIIAFELALRFLTDFLSGDRYFKISAPLQNLVSARLQLAIALQLSQNQDQLQAIIDRILL